MSLRYTGLSGRYRNYLTSNQRGGYVPIDHHSPAKPISDGKCRRTRQRHLITYPRASQNLPDYFIQSFEYHSYDVDFKQRV